MRSPLWLDLRVASTTGPRLDVTATLARCRNCGQVKVLSRPCGFDHLAAIMEFNSRSGDDAGVAR